jgi:hypothetical protein
VIDRIPERGSIAAYLKQWDQDKHIEHKQYITQHGWLCGKSPNEYEVKPEAEACTGRTAWYQFSAERVKKKNSLGCHWHPALTLCRCEVSDTEMKDRT